MKYFSKLQHLLAASYLVNLLLSRGEEGITRAEFTTMWQNNCDNNGRTCRMSRANFIRLVAQLESLGLKLDFNCHNNRYTLKNASIIHSNPIMEKMINCLIDFQFADYYRMLGDAIQPEVRVAGRDHLFTIGGALEHHFKLRVVYHPFGEEAYEAILHPYCLKQDKHRWYLLAHKENNTHNAQAQTFALDRMEKIIVTNQTFDYPKAITPSTYFRHSFGIWVDKTAPVETVTLLASAKASDYLNTLPLHHSQTRLIRQPDGRFRFKLYLCITPDFINEILRWGPGLEVLEPISLREAVKERLRQTLGMYE